MEAHDFQGIPIAILETYIDSTMQLRGSIDLAIRDAMAQGQADDRAHALRANHEYVLQGRMEGAALVWHRMSGERDESDAELASAAVEYAKTYRPDFRLVRT